MPILLFIFTIVKRFLENIGIKIPIEKNLPEVADIKSGI
jgi:hypothetical protein